MIDAMSIAGPASEPPSVGAARLLQTIETKFRHGLKAARAPTARGPGPDAAQLRMAYLDLLKLCLCDLTGTRTSSVARTFEGDVMSRELDGDQLRFRTAGMDWPLHGLTMVGLARLDDLQRCVESVVHDRVSGDMIEAGTWRGGSSILMRATLDSLGEDNRTVWVADSFQGFPDAGRVDSDDYDLAADLAAIDFLAVPLDEVRASFARFGLERGVSFIPGFFEETLTRLGDRQWSIVRLDGDTYDATRLSLEALYPSLSSGGYLIADDYFQIDPCREAVDDFRREHGISEPLHQVDWSCARWRRETEPSPGRQRVLGQVEDQDAEARAHPRPVQRTRPIRVPAIEEVELRHELDRVRSRLSAAEEEINRLAGSPLGRWREKMRRGLSAVRRRAAAVRSKA